MLGWVFMVNEPSQIWLVGVCSISMALGLAKIQWLKYSGVQWANADHYWCRYVHWIRKQQHN